MPWQLSGNGRSGWSTKLIRGLKAEAAAGFQSRRERCRESTPVTPQYAPFASYKAPRVHIAARRRGHVAACGACAAGNTGSRLSQYQGAERRPASASRGPSGPEGRWLYRASEHRDRIPFCRESERSAVGTCGRSGSSSGPVIIAGPTPAALAAKAATATIPIVFEVATDPVALGLVASLNRPGGNVTGVTNLGVEVTPKRLQLLHELLPTVTNIALLINPGSPRVAEALLRDSQAAANALGLTLHVLEASTEPERDTPLRF